MGLTKQATGVGALKESMGVEAETDDYAVVALAGNPNTGKSTVFNRLTGLNQHTGNWPGKTVVNAQGRYLHKDKKYVLMDLPGTYSLLANSVEEQVARDFICFGKPSVTVVVTDATSLERNLNLVLQIMEISDKVILCVNLMDEAKRKKIELDLEKLSAHLGIPVIGTSARDGSGLIELKDKIEAVASGKELPSPVRVRYDEKIEKAVSEIESKLEPYFENKWACRWAALRFIEGNEALVESLKENLKLENTQEFSQLKEKIDEISKDLEKDGIAPEVLRDAIASGLVKTAEQIGGSVTISVSEAQDVRDRKIDAILTSRLFGLPIMAALLGIVFWITIVGSNIPSGMLSDALFAIEGKLTVLFAWVGVPNWIHDVLILGVYRTLAWVVSVMLPPMAIFFPLFTLLEDLGYLPRVAFNLDHYFKKACAHGKQALTMCMGFGCNAAGVIACRIIDSPRERLIAIITNNFVPCNGRFPTLIALSGIFIAHGFGKLNSLVAALSILASILLGVMITLFVSRLLSKTILKGLPSSFTLELPPYRRPQIGQVIVRSIFDRTLFVLGRAVTVAAPAGLVIWAMANLMVYDVSLLDHCAQFLQPFASLLGMDGYILMAFILGMPANEIVIPILIMSYLSKGSMLELDSLLEMRQLFLDNGWTWLTAVCTMLFSLNHWPCATTLLTIRKETQSWKWTGVSFLVPTVTGIVVCFIVAQSARLFGLV